MIDWIQVLIVIPLTTFLCSIMWHFGEEIVYRLIEEKTNE